MLKWYNLIKNNKTPCNHLHSLSPYFDYTDYRYKKDYFANCSHRCEAMFYEQGDNACVPTPCYKWGRQYLVFCSLLLQYTNFPKFVRELPWGY
ncbi:hypothetical protein EhV18_00129 [Emiliania huxleyi virus 18]|nr:hypothetical protein EhV18_00129 [Emiliania huxleyi virus 18]AHA55222.1 hypothetical protein EhV156_00125 [Emiliania huxleyi virus 156]